MGFWKRMFTSEEKSVTSSLALFNEIYGGGRDSWSGKTVNVDTFLEDSTAYACMRVLTEGVSQVPLHVYQEVQGRKRVASEHPLDFLLYRSPNSWQTSFEFRETVMLHLLLTNNAYVFVNRVGLAREVRELIPIEPRRVSVRQLADYSLEYAVTSDNGERKIFHRDAIWHLRGPSWNSWLGLDAIKIARNAIGLSASIEQGQAEFQKSGMRPSGMIAVKDKLDKAKFEALAAWLDRHSIGGDRYGKPMVVDREATFSSVMMSGADQQLLETRRHQVEDICRRFRVMPLMVGHPADMAARAATESIFLQHVVHSLMPWYQRIEQSADVNLINEDQRRDGYYIKLNPAGLMRGASKDQAEYFAKALGSGNSKAWMTQNEVRDGLDLDRSDDPEADKLHQPTKQEPPKPAGDPAKPGDGA